MTRPLTVFQPVAADDVAALDAVLRDDPCVWLPDARPGSDACVTHVHLGPLRREVLAEVGPLRDTPTSIWRDLSWTPLTPDDDRPSLGDTLPRFRGEIGLHQKRGVLLLDGEYDVPGGRLGEMADALALGGAARMTVSRLLSEILRSATGAWHAAAV